MISGTTPFRRHTYLGAHELGHLWLHHDRSAQRWERVYNMDSTWEEDPREDDAELCASLLLMGPVRSSPWVPKAAPQHTPDQLEMMRRAESSLQFALRISRGGKWPRRSR